MPTELKKIGSLEIETSVIQSTSLFFIIQRIGILLLSVVIIAGLLGFFGQGLLGNTTKTGQFMKVEFSSFVRVQGVNFFKFTIFPVTDSKPIHEIQLTFDNNFLNKISIKSFNPVPIKQEIRNNQIIYTFLVSELLQNAEMTVMVEPQKFGHLQTNIEMLSPKKEKIHLRQYIYP